MIYITWKPGFVYIWKNHKLVKTLPTLWRDPYTMAQHVKKILGA